TATRALVMREVLPEHEHVIGVTEWHRVPIHVVDAPGHASFIEQIEDDRIVEYPVTPDPDGRDPARRAARKVEAVWPGRTQQRAVIVRAQPRVLKQAVVERQLARGVIANRRVAVAD